MIRKLPWPRDVTVGAVSGLLGVGFIIGAMQITRDPSAFSVLGPRVAPLAIGIATVLCSVALIVQGLRTGSMPEASATSQAGSHPEDSSPSDVDEILVATALDQERSTQRLLVTFGIFTAYILVFIPLGYLLSTFAFLVVLTTYVDRRRWIRNCVFAAVFAVVVYLLFTRGLRVQLPPGLLGF